MARNRWHIDRHDAVLTLSRLAPARFDLSVRTLLPDGARLRVAHRVRQDVWRALRNVRGFAPVVRVERTARGLVVTAGGQVSGRFDRNHAEGRIEAVLSDRRNRARWTR